MFIKRSEYIELLNCKDMNLGIYGQEQLWIPCFVLNRSKIVHNYFRKEGSIL